MLSNTAVPIYYSQFRDKVLRGEIPVNENVSMEMNRIDWLISSPNVYYDPAPLDGYIKFCEKELTLVDGSPLFLLDTFKLWAEQLLCWYEYVTEPVFYPDRGYVLEKRPKRLVNKQFIITSRASAKSLYCTTMQAYFLVVDKTTTNQITTAPTMRQAEEVTNVFSTAITISRGPLFKFLTAGSLQNTTGSKANRPKLASTKKGIQNFITNSKLEIYPWSIDKLQGLRTKVSTLDEWLSGDIREDPVGAIEQGSYKIKDYVIIAVSSEGTVRNGIGDTMKMELMSILKGEYQNPHVSIWHYRLDDIKEVADPAYWPKAIPNIGKTVSYETIQREVERAEHSPSARNDILAKWFGIPCEGYTYFFTYEETLPHKRREFWQMPCSLGIDLSRGDDFCAFTFVFPLGPDEFGIKTRCYISTKTFNGLSRALREKYIDFINEGSLVVLEGITLDLSTTVYDDLDQYIQSMEYDVRSVGYDPYQAKEFMDRWIVENGDYAVEKVIQGAKTESVPLGELKDLAETRRLIFDQSIMSFCMGNAIALVDTNDNKKLYKRRSDEKIDSVSAMLDGYVAFKLNRETFE